MLRRAGSFVAVLIMLGCSDRAPQSAIAPDPGPQPSLPEYRLSGRVVDTAFRPLSGARVEVVAGSRFGTVAVTDDAGRFSMPGMFTGSVTLQASKDGYGTASNSFPRPGLPVPDPLEFVEMQLYLEPLTPRANVAGDYTLTFTADSACSLPPEARARTYSATIPPSVSTSSSARLSDARFFAHYDAFSVEVAGDYVTIFIERFPEDPGIVEQLGEQTYLAISGGTSGTFTASGMNVPFHGTFEYCPSETVLTGNRYASCSVSAGVSGVQCHSDNHRLTLVRR